jgi:SnoaL-like protein
VTDTEDYVAIRRLQNAYADVVTRRAWPELAELFRPEAPIDIDTRRPDGAYHLVGPAALGEFVAGALEQFEFFEFVILNTRIELNAGGAFDRADGRVYMSEIRTDAGTGRWNVSFGVYHDCYELEDGRWWFARRRYHSLGRTGATKDLDAFPFPHDLRLGEL